MDAFESPEEAGDPLEALRKIMRDLGLPDDADIQDMEVRSDIFRTMMRRLMPTDGRDPEQIVWETVRQTARHVVASLGPDPSKNSRVSRQVSDAVHLAELWLSDATQLPPTSLTPVAWSRAEWIEATLPSWRAMVAPVIATLAAGVGGATESRLTDGPPELAGLESVIHPIMTRAIAAMFGAHVGEGIGRAATATMTGTDLGLPLETGTHVAILPTNLAAIQQQAELGEEALLLFCALRETARQRLFGEFGWIGPQIVALVQHYAREMRIDPDGLVGAMESFTPDQLSAESVVAFQTDFTNLLFSPELTDEQRQILDRLGTLLALVEGWVDDVTVQVARRWMPDWEAVLESLRRHRVTSQPAQGSIIPMVGLTTSPKAVRDAAAFWEAVRLARGIEGRDDVWRHPEAMPEPADIADPAAFLGRVGADTDPWDDELRRFLDESA